MRFNDSDKHILLTEFVHFFYYTVVIDYKKYDIILSDFKTKCLLSKSLSCFYAHASSYQWICEQSILGQKIMSLQVWYSPTSCKSTKPFWRHLILEEQLEPVSCSSSSRKGKTNVTNNSCKYRTIRVKIYVSVGSVNWESYLIKEV